MKVLLINGSPHAEGNTYQVLNECAEEIKRHGIDTEIFHIGNEPVHGCAGCYGCFASRRCRYKDDILKDMVKAMKAADGIIIGSPTYFAGPNGALCALLDRAFFSAGETFKHKPAATVTVCRRGGATSTLERLNKYITYNEMPLVSSKYWNIVYGCEPGEVMKDLEGMQTVRVLARNMVNMLEKIPAEIYPEYNEPEEQVNFIRGDL